MTAFLIRTLETLFVFGAAGSAVVILLSFIDDIETLFRNEH